MNEDISSWPVMHRGVGKVPVLFLHGFLGGKDDWSEVIDKLAEDVACMAFDLPGHGENIHLEQLPTFDQLIDELDRQRKKAGVDRWHVAGYSMGGRIGLHYTLRYPEHTASLTLISSSPGIEKPDARSQRIETDHLWAQQMKSLPPVEFIDAWYKQSVFSSLVEKPEIRRAMITRRSGANFKFLPTALEWWGQGTVPSAWGRLAELGMPVQFVAGGMDSIYRQVVRHVKNLFPRMRVAIVEQAGHTVHLEQPDEVGNIIRKLIIPG